MKKLGIITSFLLAALLAQAALVDDFESYQLGSINTVTTTWVGEVDGTANPATSTASILADPIDGWNQAIQLTQGGTGQQWVRSALSPSAQIAQNTTGTLFVRFRASAVSDISFGLTDFDTASNDWGHFRVQIPIINGSIRIRDAGTVRMLANAGTPATQITLNSDWYYLWVVVDNQADNVKLYLNQTGADATESDRLVEVTTAKDTFAFRSAADTLDRFFWRVQTGGADRHLTLDDIHIQPGTVLTVPAMNKPYNPAVGQTPDTVNNDVDVTLTWNAGADPDGVYAVNPDIVNQYIFMASGTDPNLYYKGATGADPGTADPASEYGPVNLVPGQLHKWAVVEAISGHQQTFTPNVSTITGVDPNNIIGPTWSFTTILLVPDFTVNPTDQWVFPGDPAVFSVTVQNPTGVTYQWYKDAVALSDGGNISGATTATLTVSNAQLADEDTYFCRAHNTAGDSDSATAILRIKRLVSHYPLETNANDVISGFNMILMQEGTAGVPTLTANSVSPLVGTYSLLFDNGDHATDPDGQYAQIGAGVVNYTDITMTAWVFWDGGANWQRLFDFGNDTTHYMFLTPSNGGECRFVLNNGSGEQIVATTPLPTNQWVFVAVTLEGNTGRIYINGEPKATNTNMTINPVDIAPTLNYVGKSQYTADAEFDGMVDDLKIYNYGLDAETIGKHYFDVTGTRPCIDPAFTGDAVNIDNTGSSYCVVDLADLVMFFERWLADGLYAAP